MRRRKSFATIVTQNKCAEKESTLRRMVDGCFCEREVSSRSKCAAEEEKEECCARNSHSLRLHVRDVDGLQGENVTRKRCS